MWQHCTRHTRKLLQTSCRRQETKFFIQHLFSDRISCVWTSTSDNIVRKSSLPCQHRYSLEFKIKHKRHTFTVVLCILLARDTATNPGPVQDTALRCLPFNVRSLKSVNKHQDGSTASNLSMFQELVYSENFDIITVTETWLNEAISNKEILRIGYHIVRRDRRSEKRCGGVLMALRKGCNTTLLL